jgi:hypothetical protein
MLFAHTMLQGLTISHELPELDRATYAFGGLDSHRILHRLQALQRRCTVVGTGARAFHMLWHAMACYIGMMTRLAQGNHNSA